MRDDLLLKLDHLDTFKYSMEVLFFSAAFGTLIYLYKRLTECFKNSDAKRHEIEEYQKWLKVLISAYFGMSAFNLLALILTSHDTKDYPFIMCVSEILANFLLDCFTIGVTLYLNLQASK